MNIYAFIIKHLPNLENLNVNVQLSAHNLNFSAQFIFPPAYPNQMIDYLDVVLLPTRLRRMLHETHNVVIVVK